ncbi:MAG: anthranilate phosphoribosyltransferase [Actinomycetota bacterium]
MSDFSWPDTLSTLACGEDLDEARAADVMRAVMSGEASPGQIGALLLGLRAKGETVEEIAGFARAMREFSLKVDAGPDVIDTCGTGGDRAGTVNVSTMAALVVAGAGVPVAKHGNRAASSACGSADVLEALGVVIDLAPEGVAACIREAAIGFCFAPVFHPAMRHAGPVRRELGIPTVFNFLGPLTNPAGALRQTVGVSDADMAPKLAAALGRLGTERAMVFRGDDGLDELTVTTTSTIWDVGDGGGARRFDPASVGIARSSLAELAGGTAADNARVVERVLSGEVGSVRDAVVLNAAAALEVAGLASDIAEGLLLARESIDSGRAGRALDRLRDVSQRVRPA